MKRENVLPSNFRYLNGPITRAAALRASGTMPPKAPTKQDWKRNLRTNRKRAALDENSTSRPNNADNQCKRRAVLQDVTNVCCESSYTSCFSATKIQAKVAKQAKKVQLDVSKLAPSSALEHPRLKANSKKKIVCREVKREPYSEVASSTTSEKDVPSLPSGTGEFGTDDPQLPNLCSIVPSHPHHSPKKAEKCNVSENWKASCDPEFIDIDNDHKDPQLCSIYAADIYNNLRVAELVRRSLPTSMETVQKDITQIMRGILVDWLVEVSEEYKLVPDTLYLTVYLIDWFLSQNYIERHRLQLLGITCMLIASKYEEICPPHVEEFCFITDNTYTSIEVLKMETQVLNFFGFQIIAPTAKAFLRRFLRAAQASYKSPSYELEFLADYLAELTLVDYSFLNFLPSVTAASSVFLARWTLDQTSHPWSPTLEHYSSYKASDLKTTVLALQGLQLNTKGCPLNAIRMKYRQPKFKSVAALSSPKLLETLFRR
ncbi:PREDICTED: cyclin-A2-4-like [Populus euphratica]|uniref:B-like cyclin n=1 Tax=Populus euphratica TaxID=75702 RepID=A0AAJ6Y2D3_POPEU|nr:PREDICTED: cyclin-A2-4-like [Populus euphratica]XP_011039988.1 PREDICTED: cyclin-A2-4-like [Populus euphratica]